jgi:glutathione S-transferase
MPYVHVVIALALVEYILFGFAVGRARGRYNVAAPAVSGNEVFERYFRVHMNTLEQLLVFLPSILLFGRYVSPYIAAVLGLLFIVGRAVYFRGYVRAPEGRHVGFALSAIPTVALLLGGLIGAIRALVQAG